MVFVVSWNVAGWTTTAAAIRGSFGSLQAYLERLDADVLCIQEAKVGKKRLEQDPVSCGAADRPGFPIPGWESFWAHCADRQMNGVTTFARTGWTHRVDAAPLRDDTLDREGRCIVTYHSHATVFNVYVPNSRGGERHAFKHRFLQQLRCAMHRVRCETGKPVILAGDLNLTYRVEDCCYSNRKLCVSAMANALHQLARAIATGATTTTAAEVTPNAPLDALPTTASPPHDYQHNRREDPQSTFSKRQPLTGAESESVVAVAVYTLQHLQAKAEDSVPVGKGTHPITPTSTGVMQPPGIGGPPYDPAALCAVADALLALRPKRVRQLVSDGPPEDTATDSAVDAARAKGTENFPTLCDDDVSLADGGDVVDHVWAESLIRGAPSAITQRNAHIYTASECVGIPCHLRDDVGFALSLLLDDGMVDTFLAAYGIACPSTVDAAMVPGCSRSSFASSGLPSSSSTSEVGGIRCATRSVVRLPHLPATCWDQYRNKRYDNEGNRIDYIFVDAALVPHVVAQSDDDVPSSSNVARDQATKLGHRDAMVKPCSSNMPDWMASDHLSGFCGADKAASLKRVTAGGRYAAAPTTGTGLEKLRDVDKMLQFAGLPSTGLFVTPPQFSDHIGVCLHLSTLAWMPRPSGVPLADPGGTMYRRTSANLRDMFAARATRLASGHTSTTEGVAPPYAVAGGEPVSTSGNTAPAVGASASMVADASAPSVLSAPDIIAAVAMPSDAPQRKRPRREDIEVVTID